MPPLIAGRFKKNCDKTSLSAQENSIALPLSRRRAPQTNNEIHGIRGLLKPHQIPLFPIGIRGRYIILRPRF